MLAEAVAVALSAARAGAAAAASRAAAVRAKIFEEEDERDMIIFPTGVSTGRRVTSAC
jgi:hypothetical protein